jgi:hypothetical protein
LRSRAQINDAKLAFKLLSDESLWLAVSFFLSFSTFSCRILRIFDSPYPSLFIFSPAIEDLSDAVAIANGNPDYDDVPRQAKLTIGTTVAAFAEKYEKAIHLAAYAAHPFFRSRICNRMLDDPDRFHAISNGYMKTARTYLRRFDTNGHKRDRTLIDISQTHPLDVKILDDTVLLVGLEWNDYIWGRNAWSRDKLSLIARHYLDKSPIDSNPTDAASFWISFAPPSSVIRFFNARLLSIKGAVSDVERYWKHARAVMPPSRSSLSLDMQQRLLRGAVILKYNEKSRQAGVSTRAPATPMTPLRLYVRTQIISDAEADDMARWRGDEEEAEEIMSRREVVEATAVAANEERLASGEGPVFDGSEAAHDDVDDEDELDDDHDSDDANDGEADVTARSARLAAAIAAGDAAPRRSKRGFVPSKRLRESDFVMFEDD